MVSVLSFQVFGFVFSIAAGFLLGAVYDVLRIWRVFLHTQRRAVVFQDFFYMIFCAFFSFLPALPLGGGSVRIYLLAGEAAGWLAYYFTVGQVTARLFRWLSGLLYRYAFDPLGRQLRRFSSFVGKKGRIFLKTVKKKASGRKKRLKPHGTIVYNRRNGFLQGRRRRKVVRKNERTRKAKT